MSIIFFHQHQTTSEGKSEIENSKHWQSGKQNEWDNTIHTFTMCDKFQFNLLQKSTDTE